MNFGDIWSENGKIKRAHDDKIAANEVEKADWN